MFELAAPDAPGLLSFGAQFDPALADPLHEGRPMVGVSGVGLTLQEAFQGRIGEAIEYLSQLQTANDVLLEPGSDDRAGKLDPRAPELLTVLSERRMQPERAISWCRVTRLTDGGQADHCKLLQPVAGHAAHLPLHATEASVISALIVQRLEKLGIDAFCIDLTRERFAVPMMRVVAPGPAAANHPKS